MAKKNWDNVALILVIIGGLNWGLIGIANLNLVNTILGNGLLARALYSIVGVAALYSIYLVSKK
jgi:uncharacterized protein